MRAARFITFAVVLAVLASISLTTAYAQAYDVSFTTAITYQNVGDGTAHIVAEFYESPSDTTPIEITRPDLAAGASTSLYIGGLSEIADGFQGSATLLSDQPLLATTVQLPQGSPIVKNRPLSNGFTAGASQVLVATVLKNTYDTTSIFSIQNASSEERTLTLRFYNTAATEVYSDTQSVQPGAAYLFDAGQEAGLGSSFNGSAVVQSTGDIVGSAMELSTNSGGTACSAFEGVAAGALKYYMPSALCGAYGADTAYAVQNTSLTDPTDVTVTYSNGASETQTINPGAKRSFIACNATGMTTGFSGSATVESSATDVIAIGKAYGSGLSTAFVGASSGTSKVALPYVRWGTDADFAAGAQQRTFITVQNIGSTNLNAGDVTVQYIKYDGTVAGSDSLDAIAVESKVNSNASLAGLTSFGIYGSTYGGGAIVEGPPGSELAVVARVSTQVSAGTFASEDYNGMAVP